MADPVSVAGLVLAIPPIVGMLMTYYSDTKEAKADVQHHAADLFSLKGILEYIESVRAGQSENDVYKYDSSDFARLLEATREALRDLQASLKPKASALGHLMQRVTWSHKKKEVQEQFTRLERLKSGFMITMMGDSL